MGVGSTYPMALTPSTIGSDKPSMANGMGIICAYNAKLSMRDLARGWRSDKFARFWSAPALRRFRSVSRHLKAAEGRRSPRRYLTSRYLHTLRRLNKVPHLLVVLSPWLRFHTAGDIHTI